MNEFIAKKLGEVGAFAQVGNDTISKGRNALVQVLGEEKVAQVEAKNTKHLETILSISTNAGMIETTNKKVVGTGEKLQSMRDLYVGDQWDNGVELLEWSGFFYGAGIVHWRLVLGGAQALNLTELIEVAEDGLLFHTDMLRLAEEKLQEVGKTKAVQ